MKRTLIFILVLIFIFTPYVVSAQNGELIIPDTHEELVKRYKEMAGIAQKYKELYEETDNNFMELQEKYQEAEQNIKEYKSLYENQKQQTEKVLESNERLQDFINTQSEVIDDLLNKKNISVNTGIGINVVNPEESLILLGFEIGL